VSEKARNTEATNFLVQALKKELKTPKIKI